MKFALSLLLALCLTGLRGAPAGGMPADSGRANPPVTLTETPESFTLANGELTAQIDKRSGRLTGLRYRGLDLLGPKIRDAAASDGYWSLPGTKLGFGSDETACVLADPAANGGERVIVSCRFVYDSRPGTAPVDVDLRYALERGTSALYLYAIWHHAADYPAFDLGVGRFALKLNPAVFDYLTIDANRRRLMPTGYDWEHGVRLNLKEARRLTTGIYKGQVEHKYDYSAVLFDTPAYGWCGTRSHAGLWLINPSGEYIAGGATKVELTAHLDTNPPALPTLLNVWKGPHYGGTSCVIARGEDWTKVIGPFLLYANSGSTPDAMWRDALAQAARQAADWPYAWATGPAYPAQNGRGTVRGRIVLRDPAAPAERMSHLLVGLAAPDYTARDARGRETKVDWQLDGKYYEFWARGDAQGCFTIPHVRPGRYTLHAIADGVLGEYARADITVAAGELLDLGALDWQPVRHGRQLWDIGIPNRSAEEFRHGGDYWHWGLYLLYPKEFPHGVNYVIGRSDYRTDWNYCQPPLIEGRRVKSTTWTITFNLPKAPHGRATLRLAIAGSRNPQGIDVAVNGRAAGGTGPLPETGVMHRDGIRGYWCERDVVFDAALMKSGKNVIALTCPVTNWVQGVLYDYLRLELDENAPPPREN